MRVRHCGLIAILLLAIATTGFAGEKSDARRKKPEIPAPDLAAEVFPLWLGQDRKADRVVVLVEGFDLYNTMKAKDLVRIVYPAAKRLMAEGMDLLVVDFPDPHLAPDELAPTVERAVRAAAGVEGVRQVDVVGLSGGGIAARWALTSAETEGRPLPVRTLMLFDCPNRGVRLNPSLQALALRYGDNKVREAPSCGAVRSLVCERPSEVTWKALGPPIPGGRRRVPERCRSDGADCAGFLQRLQSLNDYRGYPKSTRLVALSQGSRSPNGSGGDLYHLWLPFGSEWTLPYVGRGLRSRFAAASVDV